MGRWKRLDKIEPLTPLKNEQEYVDRLAKGQKEMRRVQQWATRTGQRIIIAFEGWDAAGKGGTIQRLSALLDPHHVAVWNIAAPTPEERGRHYLWRFWQKLPVPGDFAIFDRTWYGRVLVERVEGFCTKSEWKRAYQEINQFEKQLSDDGVRIVKLLLHISAEEQKKRIIERLEHPVKRFKVGLDDFRNIAKRDAYLEAYDDMLERTDTEAVPWQVIATDFKWCARVTAIETLVRILSKGADLEPPPLDPEVAAAARKLWGWEPAADTGGKNDRDEKSSKAGKGDNAGKDGKDSKDGKDGRKK